MSVIRNGITAAATAFIILGLGYLVQSDGNAASEPRAVRKANQPAASNVNSVMMTKNDYGVAVFGMPNAVRSPQSHGANIEALVAVDARLTEVKAPRANFVVGSPLDGCKTNLTVAPRLAAMVELVIASPCHPLADFVVWHERMAFSGRTDADGNAIVETPALEKEATFVVTFENVEEARASVMVPDVSLYDRAVLQWRGTDNLQLHALEFGATVGDPGHIWSASTQSAELAQQGERGFMMRLGTGDAAIPFWAEVYTFPSGLLNRDGRIALQVGAVVTERNCGREIDAIGIQTNSGRLLISQELEIAMPPCDASAPSVMHANLFRDLALVSR